MAAPFSGGDVGTGLPDGPPENAQHFSEHIPNYRFAVGPTRIPVPTFIAEGKMPGQFVRAFRISAYSFFIA